MRASNRLSAKGAAALGPGKHADGAGLWLVKDESSRGKWVLRVTVHGRRREMGLGYAVPFGWASFDENVVARTQVFVKDRFWPFVREQKLHDRLAHALQYRAASQ